MPWIKIVILVLFLIPRVLPAQEIVLKGRVSDPQGNALPNAWVQLIGQNQVLAHAMSKPDGQFLMNVRSAGEFVVKASAPGFRPVIREITVRSSANSLIEIEMSQ